MAPPSTVRAVSLVPSITESLRAWGIDPIACTEYCEQPDLAHVGGTKNPDIAAIVGLSPDVVLVDRVENRLEDALELERHGLRVVDIDVRTVADVDRSMTTVAEAVGVAPPEPIRLPEPTSSTRTAFVPIWRRPWMTIGPDTYGSTLLACVGIANVFADAGVDFPRLELDEAARRRPDIVLVPSEPYSFQPHHMEELASVAPVVAVDGQDLFWWGSRTSAAAERLGHHIARSAPSV